jgi:hypothetical protein
MDEPSDRFDELRAQAIGVRVRAIEGNRALIAELQGIWRELNAIAAGNPDARRTCEHVAADIARLEKVDLALDTAWLADEKQAHHER